MTKYQLNECEEDTKEIYMEIKFIHRSGKSKYGKMGKYLDNEHTNINNNCLQDMVKQ